MRKFISTLLLFILGFASAHTLFAQQPRVTQWRDVEGWNKSIHKVPPSGQFSGALSGSIINTLPANPLLTRGRIALIVHERLLKSLSHELETYSQDLTGVGFGVIVFEYRGGSAASLRDFLYDLYRQQEGLSGAVLIGEIPYVLFELAQRDYSFPEYEDFPCDLFFMDLDGEWLDVGDGDILQGENGKYDQRRGNLSLEIWVSRIAAHNLYLLGDETEVVRAYLKKNHEFRHGIYQPVRRALIYNDDDWREMTASDITNAQAFYAAQAIQAVDEPNTTTAAHLKTVLADSIIEYLHIRSHGSSRAHSFVEQDYSTVRQVNTFDYLHHDPQSIFYSLYICAAADFTMNNYLAGAVLFNPDRPGLVAWSSSKIGGMWSDRVFYQRLGQEATFGNAFLTWLNQVLDQPTESDASWWYGMLLIGDGSLTPREYRSFRTIALESPVLQGKDVGFWHLDQWHLNRGTEILIADKIDGTSPTIELASSRLVQRNEWYGQPVQTEEMPDLYGKQALTTADLDLDGWKDLILIHAGSETGTMETWLWHEKSGLKPTLRRNQAIPLPYRPEALTSTDLGNDGLPDFIVAGANRLSFLETRLAANSAMPVRLESVYNDSSRIHWSAVGSMDADLDADLDGFAIGQKANQQWILRIYENRGDRSSFAVHDHPLPMGSNWRMLWVDFESDGLSDLLLSSETEERTGRILVLHNPGASDRTWEMQTVFESEWPLSQILARDLNQDGAADLIIIGSPSAQHTMVQTLIALKTGAWIPDFQVEFPFAGRAALWDMDGDGDTDLFFLSDDAGVCRLQVNQSPRKNRAPAAPLNFTAVATNDTVSFLWSEATDSETPGSALRYQLTVGTTVGGNDIFSLLNQNFGRVLGTNRGWSLAGLPPGRYYAQLHTVDTGDRLSEAAAETAFTLHAAPLYLICKAFLEGPYDPELGRMRDRRANRQILPSVSPYDPFVRTEKNLQGIVDWVRLELRMTPEGQATAFCDALLRSDGMLVSADRPDTHLTVDASPGSYYLALVHRNHLTVVSTDPLTLKAGETKTFDFSSNCIDPQRSIKLSTDLWGSKCGDIDRNGLISLQDVDQWYGRMTQSGWTFSIADLDGDGFVTTSDYLILFNHLP
ncbi:hypothetical protein JW992_11790 [candidate division KSB1 bacterium]|nr:hypothetical protein [candidate division KSB1 bacterium]